MPVVWHQTTGQPGLQPSYVTHSPIALAGKSVDGLLVIEQPFAISRMSRACMPPAIEFCVSLASCRKMPATGPLQSRAGLRAPVKPPLTLALPRRMLARWQPRMLVIHDPLLKPMEKMRPLSTHRLSSAHTTRAAKTAMSFDLLD